jgi:3-dehydroquinate synthase
VSLDERSYPVLVGPGVLADAGAVCARLGLKSPPVLVSNRRVLRLHGRTLLESLHGSFGAVSVITIGDGERFKNHATLKKIYEGLLRAGCDRRSWIVALGGGVVGDIAGFAAATFMRGISYVGVPTTLLAQVDSSVGGKVGINLSRGKNLIGAFHQPRAVLADTSALRTLPRREIAAGMFEVIKCAAIRSMPLLRYLEGNLDAILKCEPGVIEHTVEAAIRIKADIVASDEREANVRAVLNFGHTVGHALEAATGYRRFKHGEAVAWGMIAAAKLSRVVGKLSTAETLRLVNLIRRVGTLPSLKGAEEDFLWRALQRDKKSVDGRLRLVLLPRLGHTEVADGLDPAVFRRFLGGFLKNAAK